MSDQSYVQLPADGTGKRVRNLSLDVLQPDGTIVTVYQQVVAIADENGNTLSVGRPMPTADNVTNALLLRAVELLERIALHLEE